MKPLLRAPIACVTLAAFLAASLPHRLVRADEAASVAQPAAPVAPADSTSAPVGKDQVAPSSGNATVAPSTVIAPAVPQGPLQVQSLPSGADKSGVTSQSISVPQGAGKVQGMGESFSAQLSTGIATYSIPISLPPARGAAQPSLGLSYSSSLGHGVAGVGWELGVPFIARQTDRGLPSYVDPGGAWDPQQDRYVFNGGQELVPICVVGSGLSCAGALAGEVMPVWSTGHMYFRSRVEGAFLRFFYAPDHRTWRVQDKTGLVMELGVPLDDASYTEGLERDPAQPAHIFRWNLVREYDANGDANPASGAPHPNNAVVFRYGVVEGMGYLSDIFDTPPVANNVAPLTEYAHHTHLAYELRTDPTTSYKRGYRTRQTLRITGIDVTSKTFGASGARELVRRYHFEYDASYHPSLLTSVQLEGRCPQPVAEVDSQVDGGAPVELLPQSLCPLLPKMTFGYQHVEGYDINGTKQGVTLAGYEPIDERVTTMGSSPKHSIDEALTDLFDINSDGLPDILTTAPGLYQGNHAVFFNGSGGTKDLFSAAQMMAVHGVLGANAGIISLDNPNVVAQDLDGDGIVNLLHMPLVKDYAIYTPTYLNGWAWEGRKIATASQQSPKINFQQQRLDTKVMDVDGDGLTDVVYGSGTELQTFFALGRHPAGDGQFGVGTRTSATTSAISNDPKTACVPWAGAPVRFSDDDVRLGDMNGDGLVDIVRLRKGDVKYWPGRGNGFWGTGALDDCPGGSFGQSRDVAMTQAPLFVSPNTDELRLDDVNGDGLDDIVAIRFNAVDIWLNVDGVSWTPNRHTILNSPPSSLKSRARLADVNGSGTRDILWGDGYAYKYIDLEGGTRPWVLTHVDNGLGKTTELEYSTTVAQMLAAETAGQPWSKKAPMSAHVVTRVTEKDNLNVAGRPNGIYVTNYEYRDPVYDGRQREFRGFSSAKVTRVGDANGASAVTESSFLLGECKDETPQNGIDECALSERWRDNPREALKGLPVLSEVKDESGVTLSTTHHTYRLRELYKGLDGRAVRYAFESGSDAYSYDTGPFTSSPSTTSLPEVELEATLGTVTADSAGSVIVRSAAHAHVRSHSEVDTFGNATKKIADGCVDGCATPDEVIASVTTPGRRNDDPSGWMWRTVEGYVTGASNPQDKRQQHFTDYDLAGNPTSVHAQLAGSLPLDRFHASAKSTAPTPASASADGLILASSSVYDGFGNMTSESAPNSRCRSVVYDAPYAQLATMEVVYAGAPNGNCGSVTLSAQAAYDRGLGLVTQVQDLHNELTLVEYDGFGRLTQLTKPDPVSTSTLSALPSVKIEYFLTPNGKPFSLVHTQTQDGTDPSINSYRNAWAYVDGMGRPIVTLDQADPNAGDLGDYVVNGLSDYDAKGEAQRVYLAWFWTGNPQAFPLADAPATKSSRQRYDAFGRVLERYGLDGKIILRNVYHALSQDAWDAADLSVGPHSGTFATASSDGHGRSVSTIERTHVGNVLELRETKMAYLPTGEPISITRQRGSDSVTRWMRYDTLGRMVLNVDPHTTVGFNADPSTDPSTLKAWRYAYDDNGDIVGTSDARGCGENFAYDAAGRLVTEDYSPCLDSQADYTAAAEVTNRYDFADPDLVPNFTIDTSLLRGRLVSVSDRAQKTLTRFDGRGRVTGIAKRIAKDPGVYAPRWYTQTATFDGADRPSSQSSGAQVAELLGQSQQSFVTTDYTKRGTVKSVGSSYGTLVDHAWHDADGLPVQIEYGDLAHTTTDFGHDDRRRLRTVQTYRGPPVEWTAPPVSYSPAPNLNGPDKVFQSILEDAEYLYDDVDNPTEIRDWRNPAVWPDGAKPVTQKAQYDDLYRLTKIQYQYTAGDDTWTDPYAPEHTGTTDTRRGAPSPEVSFGKRVLQQSYQYDWLGNLTDSQDDAKGFYDRSLGAQTHSGTKPYQLTAATGAASTRDGNLTLAYDAAGNMSSMALVRNGPCLPSNATCSQRFAYDWDEVGRLGRARRWDQANPGLASDPLPQTTPAVELRYTYDASDGRVLKTAVDASSNERHTAYIFGSLELRGTTWDGSDFADTKDAEVAYLFAHGVRLARLHYSEDSLPTLTSGKLHVLLELPDHLGSSSIVVDRETGELVEKSSYQAYGNPDSDYRPARWSGFREDYRFTGKEEDVEVGVQYFGKRYLAASLGRWLSPDPLAVHSPGSADLNLYAYVHGAVLRATDPLGLDGEGAPRAAFEHAADVLASVGDDIAGPGAKVLADVAVGDFKSAGKDLIAAEIYYHPVSVGGRAVEGLVKSLEALPTDLRRVATGATSEARAVATVDLIFHILNIVATLEGLRAAGASGAGAAAGETGVAAAGPKPAAVVDATPSAVGDAAKGVDVGAAAQKTVAGPPPVADVAPPPKANAASVRPATQQPRGGNGVVLRDAHGATQAEIDASTGGPGGGSRVGQGAIRQNLLDKVKTGEAIPCWRCGQTSTNPADMHLGHRNVPTSQGGNLSPANVCLEGAACNLSSGNRGGPSIGMSCAERGSCGAPYGR